MSAGYDAATSQRTHLCGELRSAHCGQRVRLGGWVHRRRNLGGLVFIDLRDRAGLVQVSFNPALVAEELVSAAAALGPETVVSVEGEVVARPANQRNSEIASGDVEIQPTALRVIGPAATPAIPVARGKGEPVAAEELRLRHRVLDLRRPELQRNLILRHKLMQASRRYLSSRGFLEVETPILTKPTPEGARDYLVPSRVHPSEFYALPQSPQLYKQLLMMAGLDRYFQIARCFRDEDLRADRQPEFTQIDVEASFVAPEDVFAFTEELLVALWKEADIEASAPFQRMTYAECMESYGCDRPDLRYGLEIDDLSDVFRGTELSMARTALETGGRVRGMRVSGGASLSRKQLDDLDAVAKASGASSLLRLKQANGVLEGPAAKFLSSDSGARLALSDGDLVLMLAGPDHVTSPALDRVRQDLARRLALVHADEARFVWVTDFPLFELDRATGVMSAVHHPFTSPHPDDEHLLGTEPQRVRALAYDVVLNGTELGGGSIRISNPALQSRIFSMLGIDEDTARERFGFLLEGLRGGAPPHGGIALGFDRIAMLLSGAPSLRDVIAFPKTTAARALFEGAPAPISSADLEELHLRIQEKQ